MASSHNKEFPYGCILSDKEGTIFFDLSLDSIPSEKEKEKIYENCKAYSKKLIQQLSENKRLDKENNVE